MNEINFVPKLNWRSLLPRGVMLILIGGSLSWGGFVISNIFLVSFGLLFVILGLIAIIAHPKLIVLAYSEIILKRSLLPDLVFRYDDFTDYGGNAILFGNRGIPLQDMTNAQELIDIFSKKISEKRLQPTGKYVADINRTNQALKFSVIPSVVVSFVATYLLKKYFNVQYDGKLVAGIISIIMLFVIYFILLKMEEFKKE